MKVETKFDLNQRVYWLGDGQVCSNIIIKIVVTVTPSGTVYEDYFFKGGYKIATDRLATTKEELLKKL